MDFVEVETSKGKVLINMEDVAYVQSSGSGTEAILVMKSGMSFQVLEEYNNVSNYFSWVAAGRPDLDHCPDCGEELKEIPQEEDDKSN